MPEGNTPSPGRIFTDREWSELAEDLALSPRETQTVQCLFDGQSDKQIANNLQIGIPTVRTHMSRLFRKLTVSDREELILHVFSHFRADCQKLSCPRQKRHQNQ